MEVQGPTPLIIFAKVFGGVIQTLRRWNGWFMWNRGRPPGAQSV